MLRHDCRDRDLNFLFKVVIEKQFSKPEVAFKSLEIMWNLEKEVKIFKTLKSYVSFIISLEMVEILDNRGIVRGEGLVSCIVPGNPETYGRAYLDMC